MKKFRSINTQVEYKILCKFSSVIQDHTRFPRNTFGLEQPSIPQIYISVEAGGLRATGKYIIFVQPTIQNPSCFYSSLYYAALQFIIRPT